MVTQTKPRPAAALEPHRFTVDQYYAMAKAGILKKEDRVELIDGVIVAMAPGSLRWIATPKSSSRRWTGVPSLL